MCHFISRDRYVMFCLRFLPCLVFPFNLNVYGLHCLAIFYKKFLGILSILYFSISNRYDHLISSSVNACNLNSMFNQTKIEKLWHNLEVFLYNNHSCYFCVYVQLYLLWLIFLEGSQNPTHKHDLPCK